MIREIVSTYLERLGYFVLEAKNGRAAIEIIDRTPASEMDLIVTDLLMPKAGGELVLKRAIERGVIRRFIIISGFSNQMSMVDERIRNDSLYLEKPFSFADLEETVRRLYSVIQ